MIDYRHIRQDFLEALGRYINDRIAPGHFLRAVLENDLREAVGRADEEALDELCSIVAWIYNEAPGNCWGSRERVQRWLERKENDRGE